MHVLTEFESHKQEPSHHIASSRTASSRTASLRFAPTKLQPTQLFVERRTSTHSSVVEQPDAASGAPPLLSLLLSLHPPIAPNYINPNSNTNPKLFIKYPREFSNLLISISPDFLNTQFEVNVLHPFCQEGFKLE